MSVLETLHAEHQEVELLVRELARIVRRPLPPAGFERIRREFAVEIRRHLRHEDAVLYPLLLASHDRRVRAAARRLMDEAGGLARQFDEFCERWSGPAILAGWSDYCDETAAMLRVLERRIATEEFKLYPLFAREQRAGEDRSQAA